MAGIRLLQIMTLSVAIPGSAIAQQVGPLFSRWHADRVTSAPERLSGSSGVPTGRLGLPEIGRAALADSVRVIFGYQHWRGAKLGLAIGAGVGFLLGAFAPIECSDCQPWSRGRTVWTLGLLGAGTGGVVGFLAGLASPKYRWVPTAEPEGPAN